MENALTQQEGNNSDSLRDFDGMILEVSQSK